MHFKRSQSVWEIVGVREEKNGMREWKLGQGRKVGRRYTAVKLVGKHISWKDQEWDRLRNQERGCGQGGKNSVYSLLKCLIRIFPPPLSRSLSQVGTTYFSRFGVGKVFFAPVDQYMSEGCRSKGLQGCENRKRMKNRNKADILFSFPLFKTCWTRQCSAEVNCWELRPMFGDSSIPLSSRKNKQPHV